MYASHIPGRSNELAAALSPYPGVQINKCTARNHHHKAGGATHVHETRLVVPALERYVQQSIAESPCKAYSAAQPCYLGDCEQLSLSPSLKQECYYAAFLAYHHIRCWTIMFFLGIRHMHVHQATHTQITHMASHLYSRSCSQYRAKGRVEISASVCPLSQTALY